jgi:hypothetical protein
VVGRQPFRGPTTIDVTGSTQKEQVIGHELAQSLLCAVAEKEVV